MITTPDDEIHELETEYREAVIISCPHCPHEYEENPGAFRRGKIFTCPKCNYRWINAID